MVEFSPLRGENSTFFIIYYLLSKKGTPFRMCLCVSKTSLWEGGGPKGRRERASPLPETFVPA